MDSYSNKINRIKYTIDEIREDIEQMKMKNEKTINTMMTSITPPPEESQLRTDNIPSQSQMTLNEEEKDDLIHKYKYDAHSKSIPLNTDRQQEIVINDNTNIKQSEPNYSYEINNSASNYESEIANMRAMIIELQTVNDNLSKSYLEEQKKNQILLQRNNDGNKELIMIQNQLGVSCVDDILPRLEELIRENSDNKLRDELIEKMMALYVSLTGVSETEVVNIKTIWRWIKHLISTVKDLASEKEKGKQAYYQLQETNVYKDYCVELMQEFNLGNLDELKTFVNDLLARNNINKKRVEKIKRVLSDPQQRNNSKTNLYTQQEHQQRHQPHYYQ